jgi:hypothetical protein
MRAHNPVYQSYLLRMWRESADGEWHASLQDVATSECKNFPNLASLFVYLCDQVDLPPAARPVAASPEVRGVIKKKD